MEPRYGMCAYPLRCGAAEHHLLLNIVCFSEMYPNPLNTGGDAILTTLEAMAVAYEQGHER